MEFSASEVLGAIALNIQLETWKVSPIYPEFTGYDITFTRKPLLLPCYFMFSFFTGTCS